MPCNIHQYLSQLFKCFRCFVYSVNKSWLSLGDCCLGKERQGNLPAATGVIGGMRITTQDFLPPKSLLVLPDQAVSQAGNHCNHIHISHTSYNFLIFIYELWFSYLAQLHFTVLISCSLQNNSEKFFICMFMRSAPRKVLTKLLTRLDKKKPKAQLQCI